MAVLRAIRITLPVIVRAIMSREKRSLRRPTALTEAGSRTFAAAGRDVIPSGPVKGSVAATLALTGRFGARGAESGTVTTTYNGPAKRCGGRSNYATRG